MKNSRPKQEILVGDTAVLEFLAAKHEVKNQPHPLQKVVEEAVSAMLTDDEKEIFYLRFGERMPHRSIAERLGYTSHKIIQDKVERIQSKIKERLETT